MHFLALWKKIQKAALNIYFLKVMVWMLSKVQVRKHNFPASWRRPKHPLKLWYCYGGWGSSSTTKARRWRTTMGWGITSSLCVWFFLIGSDLINFMNRGNVNSSTTWFRYSYSSTVWKLRISIQMGSVKICNKVEPIQSSGLDQNYIFHQWNGISCLSPTIAAHQSIWNVAAGW